MCSSKPLIINTLDAEPLLYRIRADLVPLDPIDRNTLSRHVITLRGRSLIRTSPSETIVETYGNA
jgi:hypothetical protein